MEYKCYCSNVGSHNLLQGTVLKTNYLCHGKGKTNHFYQNVLNMNFNFKIKINRNSFVEISTIFKNQVRNAI